MTLGAATTFQEMVETADKPITLKHAVCRLMARSTDSNFLLAFFRDKTLFAGEIRRVVLTSFAYLIITTTLLGVFYHQLTERLLAGNSPLLFVSEDIALASDAVPGLGSVLTNWFLIMLAVNVVLTLCVGVYIARRLGRPILAMKRALLEIGSGNLDVQLRSEDDAEFGEISKALSEAMLTVRLKIGEAKQSMQQVKEQQQAANQAPDDARDKALDNCRSALDFFQTDHQTENQADHDTLELLLDDDTDGSGKVA